jgi:hypothetical protein
MCNLATKLASIFSRGSCAALVRLAELGTSVAFGKVCGPKSRVAGKLERRGKGTSLRIIRLKGYPIWSGKKGDVSARLLENCIDMDRYRIYVRLMRMLAVHNSAAPNASQMESC